MLEKIRRISHHYLFKLFFVLIAIVFALSLGSTNNSQSNEIAQVGNGAISLTEFLQAKQELVNQIDPKQNIPIQQISNLALKRLITKALLKQEVESLGLKVSPETLAEYIRNDNSFHKDGEFDLEIYKKLLAQNNLSEKVLLKNLSDQVASQFLTESISINLPLKTILNNYLYKYLTEKRNIALVTVDTNQQNFTNFVESDLLSYYQKHQDLFQTKEKRSYSYIQISFDDLRKNAVITDADLQKEYQENVNEYTLPETRDFYHFVCPTEKLALDVENALKSNPDPALVAKQFVAQNVISEKFTNHPSSSFIAGMDPRLFSLQENEVTGITKSDLGWHIFKVIKIHPKEHETFAESKAKLEEKLRLKIAQKQVYELSNSIEDDIASGTDLKEIAKNHNLVYSQVKEASTNDPITLIAFKTELNEESPVTEIKAMGQEYPQLYVVVKLEEIIPSKTKDYAEVTNIVKDLYTLQLRNEFAQELAKTLQANYANIIKDGKLDSTSVQALLAPVCQKYKVSSNNIVVALANQTISRPMIASNPDLSADFITEIFSVNLSKASSVKELATAKYGFAGVTKILFDQKKDQQIYQYADSITDSNYRNSLYDQYINYLGTKHKISINNAMFEAASTS